LSPWAVLWLVRRLVSLLSELGCACAAAPGESLGSAGLSPLSLVISSIMGVIYETSEVESCQVSEYVQAFGESNAQEELG